MALRGKVKSYSERGLFNRKKGLPDKAKIDKAKRNTQRPGKRLVGKTDIHGQKRQPAKHINKHINQHIKPT